MRNKKKALGLISAGLLSGAMALTAMSASATTLEKLKFDEIVMKASACVVGEAINIEYGQDEAGIYTLTTFNVSKVAFGDVGDTITVRSSGGRIKQGKLSAAEVSPGSPTFFQGTQAMLFLAEGKGDTMSVVGFNQGIFPMGFNSNGSKVNMPQSMGGLASVDTILDRARARRAGATIQDVSPE